MQAQARDKQRAARDRRGARTRQAIGSGATSQRNKTQVCTFCWFQAVADEAGAGSLKARERDKGGPSHATGPKIV